MIVLGFDVESTGLDKQKDRIIELGLVLYSTGQNRVLESNGFLVQSEGVAVTEEITGITGVTQAAVDRFGYPQEQMLIGLADMMEHADALIGHYASIFDIVMVKNAAKRINFELPELPLIDTMYDIPGVKGEQLITMCAKKGFVNQNQHGALGDATSTVELARRHALDGPEKSFEKMLERAKSPLILFQSHQDRNRNDDAKKFQFRWNPNHKIWWKAVKEMDIESLVNQAPFDVSRVEKEITLEQLQDS